MIPTDDDGCGDVTSPNQVIKHEAHLVALPVAEPAYPGGKSLERNALLGQPDPATKVLVARKRLEHGLIGPEDFRDFVFTNPVRFYTTLNPAFFEGTRVAEAARQVVAEEAR